MMMDFQPIIAVNLKLVKSPFDFHLNFHLDFHLFEKNFGYCSKKMTNFIAQLEQFKIISQLSSLHISGSHLLKKFN